MSSVKNQLNFPTACNVRSNHFFMELKKQKKCEDQLNISLQWKTPCSKDIAYLTYRK